MAGDRVPEVVALPRGLLRRPVLWRRLRFGVVPVGMDEQTHLQGVSEDFSWLRTLGSSALLSLPWLFALLKAWEWAERSVWPERWEAKKRQERDRRRLARTRRRR